MRIRSSFDDQSLYRSRGRPAADGQLYRRLLRLLLAMVLVIAVMRQAANPRIYEVFFTAPPVAADFAANQGQAATPVTPAQSAGGGAGEATAEPALAQEPAPAQEAVDQIVAALDVATNKRLMQALAQARATERPPDRLDLPEELVNALDTAAREAGLSGPEPVPLPQVQEALDRWALQRVDPAAIWKASDTLAFYRLLDEPTPAWLARQYALQASVTSLLQQPEVYQHRRVMVPATVARAIRRQAAENPFGVSDYWELWLRPRDGSDHPLVFFTREVTPEIAQVPADAALLDGPVVWADGVYLKRLAHRSAGGGELSPALVGTLHSVSASVATAAPAEPAAAPSGWLLVGLAALIGFSAVLLIAYQNRKLSDRTGALRRAATAPPPEFLHSLDDSRDGQAGAAP